MTKKKKEIIKKKKITRILKIFAKDSKKNRKELKIKIYTDKRFKNEKLQEKS